MNLRKNIFYFPSKTNLTVILIYRSKIYPLIKYIDFTAIAKLFFFYDNITLKSKSYTTSIFVHKFFI